MAKLTNEALPALAPTTSEDSSSAISSPASEAGVTRSDSLAGPMTDLFGRAVVPASRSRLQVGVTARRVANGSAMSWLDRVFDDLEDSNYSVAAADLCAASVGANHVRQRLFWCGIANDLSERVQRGWPRQVSNERAFSWCQDVRRVEDLRGRSDLPEPLVRRYSDGVWDKVAIRGYGNAIVPQVAAAFISAYLDIVRE